MQEDKKQRTKQRIVTTSIVVVAVLLLVSILLLLFLPKRSGTSSSTGNVIEGPSGEVIKFADIDSVEGSRFSVDNMFPGDSESKTYYIEILDSNVKAVSFKAEIASESAALSDVLAISSLRAEISGEETEFAISVSLDTTVENEYQTDEINIDFSWWVDEADYVGGTVSDGDTTGDGDKCCPWCFGICPWCWILLLILVIALLIVIVILIAWLIFRNKKIKEAAKTGTTLTAKDVGLAALFGAMGIGASIAIHKLLDRKDKKDR